MPLHIPVKTDLYFSQEYGIATAMAQRGEWREYTSSKGNIRVPLILRSFDGSAIDAQSPYGYSGVIVDETLGPVTPQDWDSVLNRMREDGLVTAYLRQSPLVNSAGLTSTMQSITVDHPTYLVNVENMEQAWETLKGRTRTAVRKAGKNGVHVTVSESTPQQLSEASPFRELYDATMRRVEAGRFYFFDEEYFATLQSQLGHNLLIVTAWSNEDQAIGSALFMRGPEVLHYHLSGTNDTGRRLEANSAILWEAIKFAASEPELKAVHLGGGVSSGDRLDKFKSSFGGQPLLYSSYGLILDKERYASLVEDTAPIKGWTRSSKFFPMYRSPHIEEVAE